MEHEHYTSGPEDERRAWLPIVAVVVLVAALVGSIFLPWRDEGPAEVTGTPPSLGAPASTVAATTTPSVTAPVDLAPPPVTLPPAPTTDEPLDTGGAPLDETAQDLRDALGVVADGAAATIVTDVVAMGSARYAMIVRGDEAELYRWSGSAWERDTVLDTPSSVQAIDVADVTGDGIDDFIVSLVGLRSPGGVFSRETFNFDLLPFNLTTGPEEWVDDLHLSFGLLVSDITVDGTRSEYEWTWTGRQFEVLG